MAGLVCFMFVKTWAGRIESVNISVQLSMCSCGIAVTLDDGCYNIVQLK
jgi:hypothetical protein